MFYATGKMHTFKSLQLIILLFSLTLLAHFGMFSRANFLLDLSLSKNDSTFFLGKTKLV
uniref:Uncharacterized protein n=1 Tax=Arundo donax TaxID=35708 RepID=A0A0A9BJH8_ARUDO